MQFGLKYFRFIYYATFVGWILSISLMLISNVFGFQSKNILFACCFLLYALYYFLKDRSLYAIAGELLRENRYIKPPSFQRYSYFAFFSSCIRLLICMCILSGILYRICIEQLPVFD